MLLFITMGFSHIMMSQGKVINPPKNDGVGIAKVQKINGIDVYCMSTPLTAYTKVGLQGNLKSKISIKTIASGSRETVSEKMNKLVNETIKASEKEGFEIDAIIYNAGKNAMGIKYATESTPSIPLAKVQKINNVLIYAFAEPENSNYTITSDKKAKSGGFTTMATAGIVNSSIDEDLKKMIERLGGKGKNNKIDAVIYSSGKKGLGVKFN